MDMREGLTKIMEMVFKSQPTSSAVHVPSTGEEDKIIVKTKNGTTIQIGKHDEENLEHLRDSFDEFIDEEEVEKDSLDVHAREHISGHNFAFPKEKKYPIHDIEHAKNALARSSGKPAESKVRAAVYRKYPSLKPTNKSDLTPWMDTSEVEKGGPGSGPQPQGASQRKPPFHLVVLRPNTGYGRILGVQKDADLSDDMDQLQPPLDNLESAVLKAVLGDETLDAQAVIQGMDWELAHGVNDPDVARETAIEVLGHDPLHYKLLMDKQNSSDDVLDNPYVNKDTLENEESPFAGEGYNIDIGSGQVREPGFIGLDLYPYDHGTVVHDVHGGLPFDDGTAKCVRMVNSLHTMDDLSKDPKALLSEIHRVLMPGGQFIYEGPEDIYNGPEWSEDYPGLVLTNYENNGVEKSYGPTPPVHQMEFTRIAVPDAATAQDAEPRIGVRSMDELPSDALLAIAATDYAFSDSTSSGKGNRLHGYPSQGALLNKESAGAEKPRTSAEQQVDDAFNPPPVNPPRPKRPTRKSKSYPILKSASSPMKQIVYCVVLAPGEVDTQDEWMRADEIEKAAHAYLIKSRVVGVQHSKVADSQVVESYIAPQDMEFNGPYGPQTVTKGSWVIGIKVSDPDLWQKVLDGEITGVSVGGFGIKDDKQG